MLDEPTNDLDVETLELLEERLVEFSGTLLVVSHDRAFLDNVVTSTLVFEGEGRVQEYVGGYSDAMRQRRAALAAAARPAAARGDRAQGRGPRAPEAGAARLRAAARARGAARPDRGARGRAGAAHARSRAGRSSTAAIPPSRAACTPGSRSSPLSSRAAYARWAALEAQKTI